MGGDPGLVRTLAAVLFVIGAIGFVWYVQHAARAIALLRVIRAQRQRLRRGSDRLAARRPEQP